MYNKNSKYELKIKEVIMNKILMSYMFTVFGKYDSIDNIISDLRTKDFNEYKSDIINSGTTNGAQFAGYRFMKDNISVQIFNNRIDIIISETIRNIIDFVTEVFRKINSRMKLSTN